MLNITMPIWVLLVSIGVPCVSLMALIVALIRAKTRHRRGMPSRMEAQSAGASPTPFNADVYKNILNQQIDAVFMSLATIIETEKIKLKALLTSQSPMTAMDSASAAISLVPPAEVAKDGVLVDSASACDLSDQVQAMTEKGLSPKEIARDLGLSLSEVVLALRLNNNIRSTSGLGGQLEAVA